MFLQWVRGESILLRRQQRRDQKYRFWGDWRRGGLVGGDRRG
jgi:hypothetical protein